MNTRFIITPMLASLLLLASLSLYGQSMNGFDLSNSSLPIEEILSGGPPRDGIPAIDQPTFVEAREAEFLNDDDRVLGLNHNGITKAYPIRILNWHEIVNDKFSTEPVVVSFCPLCGTGTAFSTANSKAKTFGVSGLLYNSDLLLYDRETESLWSQILSEAISGKLRAEKLHLIPIEHTTWADWRKRYPGTKVLNTNTGYQRDYNRSPYAGYENSEGIYFPITRLDRRYHPKEQVVGVEVDGHFKVYPFSELVRTSGEVIDEINGKRIIVRFDKTHRSAQLFDNENNRIPSIIGFWFAWMAFHPNSEVFTSH